MITQKEIAEKLGISRTTVARALNSSGIVNPATREKIMKLAEEFGYEKNIIGSSLAIKNKKIIYAFMVKSHNKYYTKTVKNTLLDLKEQYKLYGISLNIVESDIAKPEEQLDKLKKIVCDKVDGILMVPLLKKEIEQVVEENKNIKFVFLDSDVNEDTYYVGPDYFKSGRIAADVLVNLLDSNEKVLVLDTKEDNVSSKDYYNGFYERISESSLELLGPVYIDNLLESIPEVVDKYWDDDIRSIYSSRYIGDILDYLARTGKNLGKLKIVVDGINEKTKAQLNNGIINSMVIEQTEKATVEAFKILFDILIKNEEPETKKTVFEPKIVFKENFNF